jgi:parvulin-like peptidyl-prolyl isomerase
VVTVGGQSITASEQCTAIESLPPPQRTGYALHPELAATWFGSLVAIAQAATREHIAIPTHPQDSEVDRDNAVIGAWVAVTARHIQPTEKEIERYYSEHNHEFEQARARHILISDLTAFASRSNCSQAAAKMKAEEIFLQLKHRRQFQALATLDSDDPYTREKGGDLGYVSHHQLEPALDHALWSLLPGQTSAPFRGRFGYEIVQVEERRVQPLEMVREIIIGKMKSAA